MARIVFAAALLALLAVVALASGPFPTECFHKRSFDGYCNNVEHPEWGGAERFLARGAEGVGYVDGARVPVTTPNMRTVSNDLFRADETIHDHHGLNSLWVMFGQFVAHDLLGVHRWGDLNASEIPDHNNTNIWIEVPLEQPDDTLYVNVPPFGAIPRDFMRVIRSRGRMVNGVYEVGSDSTGYLDLDVVYGKSKAVNDLLRAHVDGLMKYREYYNYTVYPNSGSRIPPTYKGNYGEWLPLMADVDPTISTVPMSNHLVLPTTLNIPHRFFATGDGRNGENHAVQLLHGMFLRNHNRHARLIKARKPFWGDDQIFDEARRLNIAEYQAIVMYEYAPSLLRADNSRIGPYRGYDEDADATSTQLFAFAQRFGHTTVPSQHILRDHCNNPAFHSSRDGPVSGQMAAQAMPADQVANNGIPENVLHSTLFTPANRVDPQFPESLRSIRGAWTDIIVQNQMRAADNGVPGYNKIRKIWHGAPFPSVYDYPLCHASETSPAPDPIACFLHINSNITIATTLQRLYGKVTDINFYTAVVVEEPRLAVVGQTVSRIIADQFRRSRDGDRWWFEGEEAGFTRLERVQLKRTKISDLIEANFPNARTPRDAFYVPPSYFFWGCPSS